MNQRYQCLINRYRHLVFLAELHHSSVDVVDLAGTLILDINSQAGLVARCTVRAGNLTEDLLCFRGAEINTSGVGNRNGLVERHVGHIVCKVLIEYLANIQAGNPTDRADRNICH